uniref:ELMO domain-containing protein n=1 Tax=Panagrolaimus sp. JU765 TaxID=591449 RepID=A0AC34QHB8_9BILA
MAACSFQSIWSRLAAEDLAAEKAEAAEIINRAELVSEQALINKIPFYVCGLSRRPILPLRSAVLADEQLLIVALSNVNYSDANPLHWELLCSIYKFIVDSGSVILRYGNHWQKVGFQGNDPTSDLKGVGLFGLCQLLFLVSNGLSFQMTSQISELSNDKVQNFPLAVVGLNFTQFILERVKSGKLNNLATKEGSFISVVNGIYRGCFITFFRIWKSRDCTILDLSTVVEEIKEMVKRRPKYLLNMAVLRQ